jgi:SSS family solute:Na+ symporter
VPIYLQSRIFTTPEFLEKRFNKHIRTYLAVLSMIIYIFTKVSVAIFSAAVVFDTILQLNIWVSATIILVATGVYTVAGGLSAVIYTEALQTVVLLVGAIILSILAYVQVGGLGGIMEKSPDKFHLFKPVTDKEFPWTGVLVGMPLSGIWYWCSDQVIVQRVLAAKNEGHAKTGCIFAAAMKISTMFILVVPGIIAGYLFPEEITQNSNAAFPLLVTKLMPPVLKGVMISAMLAAAMSSLASVFNSASTIFTIDIYKRIRPSCGDRELIIVGKIGTAVVAFGSLAWLPFIQIISDQIFIYLQSVSSYTAPPITVLFLVGIFWKQTTSFAAMIALIGSFILGCIRFGMEIAFKGSNYESNPFMYVFVEMNFLNFSGILGGFTLVTLIVLSLLTPKKWRHSNEDIADYTINYREFFIKSFSFLIPSRWRDRIGEKVQKLKDEEQSATEQAATEVIVHANTTEKDINTAIDTETDIELADIELHEPTDTVPVPHTDLQQNIRIDIDTLREINGWHKYSWILTILLFVMLLVLVIIFR